MIRLAWWVGIYMAGACSYALLFDWDWTHGNFQGFNLEVFAPTPLYPILTTFGLFYSLLPHWISEWVLSFGILVMYLLHLALTLNVKRFQTFCGMLGILIIVLISNFFNLLHSFLNQ